MTHLSQLSCDWSTQFIKVILLVDSALIGQKPVYLRLALFYLALPKFTLVYLYIFNVELCLLLSNVYSVSFYTHLFLLLKIWYFSTAPSLEMLVSGAACLFSTAIYRPPVIVRQVGIMPTWSFNSLIDMSRRFFFDLLAFCLNL